MKRFNAKTLTQCAVLIALIIIMALTKLGYLPLGVLEVSILTVPVAIGAVMMGPTVGALLGLVFGLTSLATAPSNLLAGPLLPTHPVQIAIVCIVPRVLVGLLTGWLFMGLRRMTERVQGLRKLKPVAYGLCGAAAAALNTVLFLGAMYLLTSKPLAEVLGSEAVMTMMGWDTAPPVSGFLLAVGVANGVPELLVAMVLTAAICQGLALFNHRK